MVKYFESTSVFRFSWDEVAQGFWRRYPNPHRYRFFQKVNGSFQMCYGRYDSCKTLSETASAYFYWKDTEQQEQMNKL
jgi:hypothetical protein